MGGDAVHVTAAHAARAALDAHRGGPAVAMVMTIEGPEPGRRLLVDEAGSVRGSLGSDALDDRALDLARELLDPVTRGVSDASGASVARTASAGTEGGGGAEAQLEEFEIGGERVLLYAEVFRAPPALLVVGAGHIAVPLAQLGVLLGYRVTVLDDREDFATPVRFPEAAEVVRMDFTDPFRDIVIGPHSHVLLVTRAHKYDFDCLQQLLALERGPGYIGMIGSRRRVRAAFGALLDNGVPREKIAAVSAPVGLDIGAETPEEIAVSVAAELTLLRRGGTGERLAERERVLDRLLPERSAAPSTANETTHEPGGDA